MLYPCHTIKVYKVNRGFFTLAPDGGDCQSHALAALTQRRVNSTHRTGGWGHLQVEHGGKEKYPTPARNWNLAVQPVVSHFTNYYLGFFCFLLFIKQTGGKYDAYKATETFLYLMIYIKHYCCG
jgi:hypothetical protein